MGDSPELAVAERDLRFVRGQVWPRRREIIAHPAFGLAGASAVVVALAVDHLPVGGMRINELADIGFTFAAIAFGACVSATVLSIGLPGARRARLWSRAAGSVPGKSALSDLIFVLAWASVCQFVLIVTCSLAVAFGGDIDVAPAGMLTSHRVALALGLFSAFYAFAELLIVILTLSQIAVVIIAEEQRDPG
ncbi:hypothetical protein [Cellulomonas sp. Y8]|uniref:hypothetical protein n=1 Tax=Cellulomonas sp. Y8 TaxID=2591145 RepID=UPI0011CC354D|nr:hypothetical protein [Cellulomonas sp. Y8]